jgi:uncharacterized membrane protein
MLVRSVYYYLDLLIAVLLGVASFVFVLISPFNETYLRIVFSLPIMLFVPGYMFISALFPKRVELSYIERFTLAVGFSIAISVFDGFLLSVSPWLYRPAPTVISLLGFSVLFGMLAFLLRRRLSEEERFYLPLESIKNFLQEYVGEIRRGKEIGGLFHAIKVALGLEVVGEVEDAQAFEVSKILIIAMILSILVASGMLIYAKTTREVETFTALYVLGEGGKAENYPTEITLGEPLSILVGVENFEHATVNYTLNVQLDGKTLVARNITLGHNEKWEENVSIITREVKAGGERSKLEFLLFKEGYAGAYRSVHLWLNRTYSRSYLIENSDALTVNPLPVLENGDFSSLEGWSFSSQSENITSTIASTLGRAHVLVINSTLSGKLNTTQSAAITQSFNSAQGLATLSFHVNASSPRRSSGTARIQAVLNNAVVWEEKISSITRWMHVRIPVTLNNGSNSLSFRVQMERAGVELEIYLDDVEFKPLSAIPLLEDFTPPVSEVEELSPLTGSTSFAVRWNGSDEGVGIEYYNIDYSTDAATWTRWLSRTEKTSAQFNGTPSKTYYFRSQAVDRAGNVEQPHVTPDTNTTIDITAPRITIRVEPDPSRGPVSFHVSSTKKLTSVQGYVKQEKFNTTTNITLSNINGTHWSSAYNANFSGKYVVSVVGFDEAGNRGEGAAPFTININIANLSVEVTPEYTRGEDVRIILSFGDALKDEPSTTVKDSRGNKTALRGPTVDGTTYTYYADINSSVSEGRASISISARNIFNERISRTEYFTVDRSPPSINSVSPANGSTVSNTTTVKASYSDRYSGVDTGCTSLLLNGSVVSASIGETSLVYTPSSPLPAGTITAQVNVCDLAGNVASKTWQFTVQ